MWLFPFFVLGFFCGQNWSWLGNKNPLCPWVSWVNIGLIDYNNKVFQRLIVNICV